jgi:hypothetical protein
MTLSTLPDSSALIASLQAAAPGAVFETTPSVDLHATIYVSRDDVPAVALALRDQPDLRFTLLSELTAVDFHPREPRFEVVYLLVSIEHRRRLRLSRGDRHQRVAGRELAGARSLGSLRDRLREPSRSPSSADARGLGGLSAPQGLSGAD